MDPKHARRAAGVTLVVAVSLVAGARARSEQNAIDFEIFFDGGYIYHLGTDANKDKFIDVKTLAAVPDPPQHPLRVKLVTGKWPLSGIDEIKLDDADVQFWPNGTAPTMVKPGLPPNKPRPGCDPSDSSAANVNNLYFLPDLKEAATGMGTSLKRNPAPKRGASVRLTGGGDLSIREVAGCVQYKKHDGTPYGDKRSMASGLGGVAYKWRVAAAQNITVRISPPNNGTPFNVAVTPVGNRVELRVGSFEPNHPMPAAPYVLSHFRSFDGAFTAIGQDRRISLWWLTAYQKSPGIDCPSGADPDPWP